MKQLFKVSVIFIALLVSAPAFADGQNEECAHFKQNQEKLKKIESRLTNLDKMIRRTLGRTDSGSGGSSKTKESLSKFEAESNQLKVEKTELTTQIQKCQNSQL